MQKKKIDKTFTRTPETMQRYIDANEERALDPNKNALDDFDRATLKEFDHWVIIDNMFPYDAVADVSHMLFTKRNVPFDWDLLSDEEREEFARLRKTYLREHYDVIWENLPSGQTVSHHFHVHLLYLKRVPAE